MMTNENECVIGSLRGTEAQVQSIRAGSDQRRELGGGAQGTQSRTQEKRSRRKRSPLCRRRWDRRARRNILVPQRQLLVQFCNHAFVL